MVEVVGVLKEGVAVAGHCQLYLAEDTPVSDVDEDVVGALPQAVDHPHQPHVARILFAVLDYLIVEPDDFLLLGGALAADEVHHLEGYDILREW